MDVRSTPDQSLLDAIQRQDLAAVEAALSDGADRDGYDDDGWTPLIHAARFGTAEIFERLIRLGADPTLTDQRGWSAWAHAVDSGDPARRDAALAHRAGGSEARA